MFSVCPHRGGGAGTPARSRQGVGGVPQPGQDGGVPYVEGPVQGTPQVRSGWGGTPGGGTCLGYLPAR